MSEAPNRWDRVWTLFHDALEQPADARAAWLAAACAGDATLLAEVASLLDAHLRERTPLDRAPPAPDAPELAAGTTVGRYRIVRELGRGGMGRVYLAERSDGEFVQQVALKLVAPGYAHPQLVERFRRERQIMAALHHPHIARLIDGGSSADGLPFLVMDYVDGVPIDAWCAARQPSLRERLRLLIGICEAVDHAHRMLVVHRDIKPSNILVTQAGQAVLLDFGIAKLLGSDAGAGQTEQHGMRLLTPRYASPEQLEGGAVTTATDVYSLGVLLYELVTGVAPHVLEGVSPEAAARRIREHDPPSLRTAVRQRAALLREREPGSREALRLARELLPAELNWVVQRALKADPAQRYRSAAALADDLRALLAHRPVAARPDSVLYRARKFARRNWAWLAVGAVFAVTVTGFVVQLGLESARTRAALAETEIERDRAQRTAGFLGDLFKLADTTQAEGRAISAREVLDRGRTELAGREDLPATARVTLLNALAVVYRNLGIYDAAIELLGEARRIVDEGAAPGFELETLSNLGATLESKGEHRAAREVLERALALARERRGEPLTVAEVAERLGMALQSLGASAEAGRLFQETYALRAASLPADDGRIAEAALRVGSWHWTDGRLDEAAPWYRRALESRRAAHPPDWPQLARALDGNGAMAHAQGRYADAAALFEEALTVRRRVFGEHKSTADTLSNLGACRFDMGDDAAAEPPLREAVAMYERVLDPNAEPLAKALNNLGLVRQRQGALDEARALYTRALAIHRAAFGNNHARVAGNLNNLGLLAEKADDLAAAEAAYREALAILESTLGRDHAYLGFGLTNLARVRRWQDQREEAWALFARALAIRRKALPPGHPSLAETLSWYGYARCADTREDAALALLREALALRLEKLGPDQPGTIETRAMLGACLIARGAIAEGAPLVEAARERLRTERGATDRLVLAIDAALPPP